MQNERDFVDVFLLNQKGYLICSNPFVCIRQFLVPALIGEPVVLTAVAVRTHLYTQMEFLQG